MFSTILFPIDQSRQTMETAAFTLRLAQQHNGRLVVLSVVEPEGAMHDPAALASLLERLAQRERTSTYIRQILSAFAEHDRQVTVTR